MAKKKRIDWRAALALPAMLAAAELALRVVLGAPAVAPLPPGFRYAHLEPSRPFFAASGGLARVQRERAKPAEFALPKPAGVFRVFVVGGSVAQPLFLKAEQESSMLWSRALPGRRLELINCGMGGYDSDRDLATAREVLAYEPDMLVVLSGNNEMMGPPIRWPRAYLANRLLRGAWLWRLPQDLVASRIAHPREPEPFTLERFEANLRAMARASKSRGVPLVLCTLPTNLRDMAPSSVLPWEDGNFVAGWAKWERGNYATARKLWNSVLEKRPDDAGLTWMVARAFDRDHKTAEARAAYQRAADLEGLRGHANRCAPACSAAIRRVAGEEGAIVADLERALSGAARDGIPGADLLRDVCHWHGNFYPLASHAILSAARAAGALDGPSWPASVAQAVPRLMPTSLSSEDVDALDAFRTAASLAIINGDERLNEGILSQFELARKLSPAFWERMTASTGPLEKLFSGANNPMPFELLRRDTARKRAVIPFYVAETFRRMGRPAPALAWFDRALAEDSTDGQARLWRAAALADLGRPDEARRELERLGAGSLREVGTKLLEARGTPARRTKEAS